MRFPLNVILTLVGSVFCSLLGEVGALGAVGVVALVIAALVAFLNNLLSCSNALRFEWYSCLCYFQFDDSYN